MALSDYQLVEYISSDGTAQYIDTGVSPSDYLNALRIEGDMAWNTSPAGTSTSQFLFGTGYYSSTQTSRRTICVGYNQALDTSHTTYLNGTYVGTGVTFTGSSLDTTRRVYGIDQVDKLYIYGDQTQAFTTTVNGNLSRSIVIFAFRNSSSSGVPVARFANAKCYGFKIYASGTLIRDLVPARRISDSALGMYDKVNDAFYTNAGTGDFTAGGNLYAIEGMVSPTDGGTIEGGGMYTAGSSVVLTAIPNHTLRYKFLGWADGEEANPRTVTVTAEDATYTALFEKIKLVIGDEYRLYAKKRAQLTSVAQFYTNVISADISEDLLQSATSTIVCEDDVPLSTGDIISIRDGKNNLLYNGVVQSVEGNRIVADQIQSIFDFSLYAMADNSTDKQYWTPYTGLMMTRRYMSAISLGCFSSRLSSGTSETYAHGFDYMQQHLFNILVSFVDETARPSGLPTIPYRAEAESINGEGVLYQAFEQYGIIPHFCFDADPLVPTVIRSLFYFYTIEQMSEQYNVPGFDYTIPAYTQITVGNNAEFIRDINVITEIEETNVIIIFNSSGTTYRGAYAIGTDGNYQTTDGNGDLGDTDRYVPTRRKNITNDATLTEIRDDELKKNQYNHKIQFTFDLNNNFYNFGDLKLGENISFYVGSKYYDSILTAWSYHIEQGRNLDSMQMICGKVRGTLTSKLNMGR